MVNETKEDPMVTMAKSFDALTKFMKQMGEDKEEEKKTEPLNLDALCGDWKSVRKQPSLLIFKAAPGYMIALGKKPRKDKFKNTLTSNQRFLESWFVF